MVWRFRDRGAPMRMLCLALVLAAVVSLVVGSAAAANYTQETLDRYLRIDYHVEPSAAQPVVSGYVYNMHPGAPADRMQPLSTPSMPPARLLGPRRPGYSEMYQSAVAPTLPRRSCRLRRIGSRCSSSTGASAAASS